MLLARVQQVLSCAHAHNLTLTMSIPRNLLFLTHPLQMRTPFALIALIALVAVASATVEFNENFPRFGRVEKRTYSITLTAYN